MTMATDILGRERDITRTYPDGSFDCPFCASAVFTPATRCENPGCPASRHAFEHPGSAVHFQAKIEEMARRVEEEEQRKKNHEMALARITEDRKRHEAWLAEVSAEARARKACLRCLIAPGWERVRYVKHRGRCPKEG